MIEWIKVANIMRNLENTSSSNDKLRILKENKDNELLRKVLLYALDTDKKFGMTKKSLKIRKGDCKFEDFFDLLDTLANENINDNLKRQANFFLGNIENEDGKFEYKEWMDEIVINEVTDNLFDFSRALRLIYIEFKKLNVANYKQFTLLDLRNKWTELELKQFRRSFPVEVWKYHCLHYP